MAQQVVVTQNKPMPNQVDKSLINQAVKQLLTNPNLLKSIAEDLEKDKNVPSVNVLVNGKFVPVPRRIILELAKDEGLLPEKEEVMVSPNVTTQPAQTTFITPNVSSTTPNVITQPSQVTPLTPNVTPLATNVTAKPIQMKKKRTFLPQIIKSIRERAKKIPKIQFKKPTIPIEKENQSITNVTKPERLVEEKENVFKLTRPKKLEEEFLITRRPLLRYSLKKRPYDEELLDTLTETKLRYAPSIIDLIRERVKSIYKPVFESSYFQDFERNLAYSPQFASNQEYLYKPKYSNFYYASNAYEPSFISIASEDYAPKQKEDFIYNPQMYQEAYPTFTYSTFGLPETEIEEYSPEDKIRISPVTEFEIKAKPTPFIINKTYLNLLNNLMSKVVG